MSTSDDEVAANHAGWRTANSTPCGALTVRGVITTRHYTNPRLPLPLLTISGYLPA